MKLPTNSPPCFLLLVLRGIILSLIITFRRCKLAIAEYKFMSVICSNTHKFVYRDASGQALDSCCICLLEFADGDRGEEIVGCKHGFHTDCLEQWLRRCSPVGTCPLCRRLVVPEEIVEEYRRVQSELEENEGVEEEWVLLLQNVFNGGIKV